MKMEKLGVQLYTIREFMTNAADIRESFRKLKALGYDQAQTAGCAIPYAEFGALAKDAGIELVGTHDDYRRMQSDFAGSLADHQALGTLNMGTGGFFSKDEAEIKAFIQIANEIGGKAAAHGGRFTYHNHSHEFIRHADGKTTMDWLVEGLDPKTTSFVLDTYWVQHGGGDVRHWLEKLAGRVDILHLKDMGRNADGPFITEIGSGNLYWEGILSVAESIGVKYYVVEQDTCPGDPFESLRISSEYIHRNFM